MQVLSALLSVDSSADKVVTVVVVVAVVPSHVDMDPNTSAARTDAPPSPSASNAGQTNFRHAERCIGSRRWSLRCVHRERMPTKTPGMLAKGEGKDLHQAGVLHLVVSTCW